MLQLCQYPNFMQRVKLMHQYKRRRDRVFTKKGFMSVAFHTKSQRIHQNEAEETKFSQKNEDSRLFGVWLRMEMLQILLCCSAVKTDTECPYFCILCNETFTPFVRQDPIDVNKQIITLCIYAKRCN